MKGMPTCLNNVCCKRSFSGIYGQNVFKISTECLYNLIPNNELKVVVRLLFNSNKKRFRNITARGIKGLSLLLFVLIRVTVGHKKKLILF